VSTSTPDRDDPWTLLHDLVFSVPHPVLLALAYFTAMLLAVVLVGIVRRVWRGDRFEFGPLKLDRPDKFRSLEASLEALSIDDRLKANVLWVFRERLNEANRIIAYGIEAAAVRLWCRGVLIDVIVTLSAGGHDRHRASLWVRAGDVLRMYNGAGFRQEAVDNAMLPLASIAGNVLRNGTLCNSGNVERDPAFSPKPRSGPAYRSLLAVPVKTPLGKTIAALCVDAEGPGYFDDDDEFFAGCFADLIALLVAQVIAGDEN
jgi:hypothetical protein